MRRVLVRCLAVAVSCGAALAVGSAAAATTVPDDTEPTADSVASDPELEAALAVFEERMTAAGFENLGPLPELDMGDMGDTGEVNPEVFAECDPAVRDTITSLEQLVELAGDWAPRAVADRYGPAAPATATEGATTTTDLLQSLLDGTEEVLATAHRLDDQQIVAIDEMIALMGRPEFVECLELTMMTGREMGDTSSPEFSDLSIPDFSDLSIPDFSDLSIPELTDLSIPDFTDLSIPEFTPEFDLTTSDDLGVGDRSASLALSTTTMMDLSIETVIVRSGDVLITVSRTRFNSDEAPMDVDLVAEAQAIVDSL